MFANSTLNKKRPSQKPLNYDSFVIKLSTHTQWYCKHVGSADSNGEGEKEGGGYHLLMSPPHVCVWRGGGNYKVVRSQVRERERQTKAIQSLLNATSFGCDDQRKEWQPCIDLHVT